MPYHLRRNRPEHVNDYTAAIAQFNSELHGSFFVIPVFVRYKQQTLNSVPFSYHLFDAAIQNDDQEWCRYSFIAVHYDWTRFDNIRTLLRQYNDIEDEFNFYGVGCTSSLTVSRAHYSIILTLFLRPTNDHPRLNVILLNDGSIDAYYW